MQKFFPRGGGGQIWGTDERGGGGSLCGVLHTTLARGGGANALKYSPGPTPGAWFHRQIPTLTIGMNRGFDLYSTLHFYAQVKCPTPQAYF